MPEPAPALVLQRSIASAIRDADPEIVTRVRVVLREIEPDPSLEPSVILAALAAAACDPVIWDALCQVRQVLCLQDSGPDTSETVSEHNR